MAKSNAKSNVVRKTAAEQELVLTRVLNASREKVFRAWTDPEQVKQWWGPHGFTMPYCKIDLRPGGVYHNCMRSPEGRDYWNKGTYKEIVKPERIVCTDYFSDEKGSQVSPTQYGMSPDYPVETTIAVSIAERRGKSTLTVHQSIPESLAERIGAQQGWTESLERLEEFLEE